jgi:hypothetical protein
MRKRHVLILLLFLLTIGVPIAGAQDGDTIRWGDTTVENNFPESLTLTVDLFPGDVIVQSAVIAVRPRTFIGFANPINLPAFVTGSAENLTLTAQINSNGITIPNLPLRYQWTVIGIDGTQYESAEEEVVIFEDNRFDWQIKQNDQLIVQWHERRESFGQEVYDIASKAIEDQQSLFGEPLTFPITILIYNDVDEFEAWNPLVVSERIGGQAFPEYGITAQIVTDRDLRTNWLDEVIPHEISHLYFAQVTYSVHEKPQWLDEGVATYNETGINNANMLRQARDAARDGSLIQLARLDRELGNDERTELLYSQGLSVVTFLAETYGEDSLTRLFEAYDNGNNTEDAFIAAYNKDLGTIQGEWLEWMGVSAENYPTPTPWPLPTFPPSPTPFVPGDQATETPSPTPQPTATAVPATTTPVSATATAAPIAVAAIIAEIGEDTQTQLPSPSPTPTTSPTQELEPQKFVQDLWPIIVIVFVIAMCAFLPGLAILILVQTSKAAQRR